MLPTHMHPGKLIVICCNVQVINSSYMHAISSSDYNFFLGFSLAPRCSVNDGNKSHHGQMFPYPAIPFIIFQIIHINFIIDLWINGFVFWTF
jgi:hypothetical protein